MLKRHSQPGALIRKEGKWTRNTDLQSMSSMQHLINLFPNPAVITKLMNYKAAR